MHAARDGTVWIGTDGQGLFRYRAGTAGPYENSALAKARVQAIYQDGGGSLWIGTHGQGFGRLRDGEVEFDSQESGAVSTFFEDREGSLWIGRVGGLIRLADARVVAYSKAEGLADDDIKSVSAAPDGTIWVGSRLGVETVTGTRRMTKGEGLSSSYVLSVRAARDGSLWVGTADAGLNRIEDGRVTSWSAADGLPDGAVLALFEDHQGVMWVGTSGGLTRVVNGTITQEGLPQSFAGESISMIFESRDGAMWIGTHDHGVTRIHGGAAEAFTTRNGLSNNFVVAIHEDATGTIWIGTAGGGLNRYKDGRFTAITARQGLKDDSVFSILEDRRGNLWMSSNKGIFRAALADLNSVAEGRQQRLHSVIYGRTDGMRSRECNGGTQPVASKGPDGRMWFATTGGVAKINPDKALVSEPAYPVLIGDIFVDGVKTAAGATIPPGHRTLEFHYTSPTFKTPDKLRFHYRLMGFDDDWTDAETRRVAYYTNVPPARYRFEVRAINGEGVVTPVSNVAFVVQPFFYQTPLFWAAAALLLLAAAWSAHQYRIRIIRATAERFKLLFDRNLAGVYRARIDGRILDCNQACLRILGLGSLDELGERSIFDSYTDRADVDELLRRVREEGGVSGLETPLRRSDGTPLWVLQNVNLAHGPQGEILEATLIDITDRRLAEEKVRYQAYHDALTDLPNRAMFTERLALALAYSE
ncbi:MAG TPA: two-component regulator propeller domain-containing protein, partial [Thermoanaerobaculia bacterium]|nr:two-component regulator propeller domain-containing protein [Thermoanaerobaculia bacterium]